MPTKLLRNMEPFKVGDRVCNADDYREQYTVQRVRYSFLLHEWRIVCVYNTQVVIFSDYELELIP